MSLAHNQREKEKERAMIDLYLRRYVRDRISGLANMHEREKGVDQGGRTGAGDVRERLDTGAV